MTQPISLRLLALRYFYKAMNVLYHMPVLGSIIGLTGIIFGSLLDKGINKFSGRGLKPHFHAGLGDIKNTQYLESAVIEAMLDSSENSALGRIEEIIWENDWQQIKINEARLKHKEGYFPTPLLRLTMPAPAIADKLLNQPGKMAYFKIIAPLHLSSYDRLEDFPKATKIMLLLPSFNDQGFETRENLMAYDLAQKGIVCILLEQYSYGKRCNPTKKHEIPIVVDTVCDLILKAVATLAEGTALLRHLHQDGFKNLCIAGLSMGGGLATLIAGALPFKIATVGITPCHRFGPAFTEYVLANACDYTAVSKKEVSDLLSKFDCRKYPKPKCPEAMVILAASHDGYIHRTLIEEIAVYIGTSAQFYWLFGGHASTLLLAGKKMQQAVLYAFAALIGDKPVNKGLYFSRNKNPICNPIGDPTRCPLASVQERQEYRRSVGRDARI